MADGGRTYYVTVQRQSGEAVGGRLWLADTTPDTDSAVRVEGGQLIYDLLKELSKHG